MDDYLLAIEHGLVIAMQSGLEKLFKIWKEYGQYPKIIRKQEYENTVFDIYIDAFPENQRSEVLKEVEQALGYKYSVEIHPTHLHIEFLRPL